MCDKNTKYQSMKFSNSHRKA